MSFRTFLFLVTCNNHSDIMAEREEHVSYALISQFSPMNTKI